MKTNKLFLYLLIGCSFFATMSLSAQTLVTKWEAEDFILNGFAGGSGTEPAIESLAAFSGGKVVRGISNSNLIMQNFYVSTEGTYELKIYYSYTADQAAFQGGFITTRVNSQTKQTVATKLTAQGTAVGDVIQVYSVLIYCETGWNALKIGQNGNGLYNPYIDRCELYTSPSTITKPVDDATALLSTLYPVSFTTKNVMYTWDMTNVASSITLTKGTSTTLSNLTDNDLSTVFTSPSDSVIIEFTFQDSIVLKQIVLNDVLKLGKFNIEYLQAGEWKLLDMKSAYHLFADGALWVDTKAADLDNYLNFRLTIYKAPGAPQIEVADFLFEGFYYTKDIVNGGSTYRYLVDDIANDANGSYVYSSKAADIYNTLTGFQALDNARGSKFSISASTFKLIYRFNESARVTSFVLVNSTTVNRDAKTFEIQGSNDSLSWTTLYRVENLFWKARNYMFGGNINIPAFYKFYRFDVQVNNGDAAYSEIGDLLLFGEVQSIATELGKTDNSSLFISGASNQIIMKGENTFSYQIVDITGKLVKQGLKSGAELSIPMTKGLYLVKTTDIKSVNSVVKVIVR